MLAEIAREKKASAARIKRIVRKHTDRGQKFKKAVSKFRPKKADYGSIVFINIDGKRGKKFSDRKGYAVYVNSKGKKKGVRQYNRETGRIEKDPPARRISSIDINRVRSKKAKAKFWRAFTNEVVSGKLENMDKRKKVPNSTRFSGAIDSSRIDGKSDAVKRLAKELAYASNITASKKDFLVTIGIHITDKDGKSHFVTTQQRFSRNEGQKATTAETEKFFAYTIYGFLANELAMRGLVLIGSARHIARLKQNKGKRRDKWTKDGFLWQGHDMQDVTIKKVEFRFDQLRLGK